MAPFLRSRLLLILLVATLLLPVCAPWLNSGYAAAQPHHRHLYAGAVQYDHHDHLPATHSHPARGPEAQTLAGGTGSGVILLPDQDVAGRVLPVRLDAGDLTFWIEQTGRGTLSFALGAGYVGVMLVFLSRPVPPPRS